MVHINNYNLLIIRVHSSTFCEPIYFLILRTRDSVEKDMDVRPRGEVRKNNSTGTVRMIGTGYSELMVSFNFISRAKPGGSASVCIKKSHKNNVGVNIPRFHNILYMLFHYSKCFGSASLFKHLDFKYVC